MGVGAYPTMKEKKRTIYYRFVEQMLNALRIAHVRRYPHKQSPKKYGVWAHACILALKELEEKTYRFIVDMLAEMTSILALLEIEQAPHWTTLHKAAQRFRGSLIERIVASFVQRTKSKRVRAGIDSTGLQPTRASVYYTTVLKKDKRKQRQIRKHIKLSTVVDLDHQLPISFKIRRGPASDQWDAVPLVRKAHRIKPLKSLDADKDTLASHCANLSSRNAMLKIASKLRIWRCQSGARKAPISRKLNDASCKRTIARCAKHTTAYSNE